MCADWRAQHGDAAAAAAAARASAARKAADEHGPWRATRVTRNGHGRGHGEIMKGKRGHGQIFYH